MAADGVPPRPSLLDHLAEVGPRRVFNPCRRRHVAPPGVIDDMLVMGVGAPGMRMRVVIAQDRTVHGPGNAEVVAVENGPSPPPVVELEGRSHIDEQPASAGHPPPNLEQVRGYGPIHEVVRQDEIVPEIIEVSAMDPEVRPEVGPAASIAWPFGPGRHGAAARRP